MFRRYDNLDLANLDPAHRQEVRRRRRVVERLEHAIGRHTGRGRVAEAVADVLGQLRQDGEPLSRRTLYGWHKRWRMLGVVGLVDARRLAGVRLQDEELWFLSDAIYRRGMRPRRSMAECHRRASETAARLGWAVCPLAETRHLLSLLRADWRSPPGYFPDAIAAAP